MVEQRQAAEVPVSDDLAIASFCEACFAHITGALERPSPVTDWDNLPVSKRAESLLEWAGYHFSRVARDRGAAIIKAPDGNAAVRMEKPLTRRERVNGMVLWAVRNTILEELHGDSYPIGDREMRVFMIEVCRNFEALAIVQESHPSQLDVALAGFSDGSCCEWER